ncbi:uncharacterized protein LOC122856515 [Aphidius gifuensis]|uniref:uncharacterized protein LOC122856515 n=1 Tax=Aphidius gifuensis TaxID=684658 RepID=UPI001CDD51BC|nr:uncharacterized protein LOC122856515 [Aphidius gifuensis]
MNQLKRLRQSGSKKSLVEKYDVPSEIITHSLSEKNNKIYSYHDDDDVHDNDHSYAKDPMIIERVNDDCMAEIFMYVPACERPKIALVCKKWRRVLDDSWFNVKKLELTHWEYDENPHYLKRNYPTTDGQFSFLKSMLYKCGRYLRELDLSVYARCNILPVINEYCLNLVKLRIRINNIDDAILDNAFSHLCKLQVLKIIFHGCFYGEYPSVPTTLINSLINVAGTLTDLNISNWPAVLLETAHFPEEMTNIYSHHDNDVHDNDHSYAKDPMIIERVNDDCMAEIFMYVPACERPKIALVCKKWRRVLDNSWFNVKKLELTHWEYDENPHFLKRNYPTIDGQFSFLKSLLHKCGRFLRELDLSVYAHCNILPVINEYCPNLVKLRIRINNIDDAILDNAFSHLCKLQVLKIIFHGCFYGKYPSVPTTLINSLLNVADTLTDLNISNWPAVLLGSPHFPEEMTSVISQLKALRKLGIFGIECPKSLCDYVNNSKIIRSNSDHACYIEIKSKIDVKERIDKIEELYLLALKISDDCMYTIANTMKQLQVLYVLCPLLTDTGIVACTKMNNLQFLHLDGSNNVTDSSIKLLKNLQYLKLPFSNKITDESAIKVLENSPNMFGYCVNETNITYKLIEKAAEIPRNRENQLTVYTTLNPDSSNTQIKYEYLTVHYAEKETQPNEN